MSVDLRKLQKEVYDNKIEKGFNTTDIAEEFCRAHEELSEAFSKFHRDQEGVGEELADVAIFLLGISEIMNIDLQDELIRKIAKNRERKYSKHINKQGKEVFIRIRTEEDQ